MTASFLGFPGLFSDSSFDFQLFQSLSKLLVIKRTNYNWYYLDPSCFTTFSVLRQGPSTCLSLRFLLFFILWSIGTFKCTIQQVHPSLFLLICTQSGLLAEIRGYVWISKFQRILYVLFSKTVSGLCLYHLVEWSKF